VKRSGREGRWAGIPPVRIRFAFEAAFLILVACGAALARLSPQAIVVLMLVSWLLVALIERASSREQPSLATRDEEPLPAEVAEAAEEQAGLERREGYRWLFWRRQREAVEVLASPTAPLEERPSRAHVRRIEEEAPPVVELEIDATKGIATEPSARGPAVTKRPLDLPGLEETEPARPVAPTPQPARVEPPPPPPPAYRPPPAPKPPAREWNLWDLERRAREQAGDASRDEEWAALFMNLREFASAEGILPKEFDELVRESFAELIQAA